MPYKYTPMLRAKAGEVTALHNLSAGAKKRITPLIHVCSEVPGTFITKFPSAWQGEAAFDGLYNFEVTGSTKVFKDLVTELRAAGVPACPAVAVNADKQYVKAVSGFVDAAHPNLTVKVSLSDLPHVTGWVAANGWSAGDVDLVIVAGQMAGYVVKEFAGYVTHALSALPTPKAWRSITLASSAAPKDAGMLQRGRNAVARDDWALWNAVAPKLAFQLHYGDYSTSHPNLEEPPGVAMGKATVSAKYTVDDDFVILKGHATTGANGAPMGDQYFKHAQALMKEPLFGKLPGCWADQQIGHIVSKAVSPGNRTTWVGIAANRHLSLVADRLP